MLLPHIHKPGDLDRLQADRVRLVGWARAALCSLTSIGSLASACSLIINYGCDRPDDDAPAADITPVAGFAATPNVKRGTHVVVERSAGEFIEATVLEVQGDYLRLQSADGAHSLRVPRTNVYSLSETPSETAQGEYAICGVERLLWIGCKVLGATRNQTAVITTTAHEKQLPRRRVLSATELTRMNVRHAFARLERRTQFLKDLKQAGSPHPPQGWRPGPRERVIARRDNDWYAATVHEIEDDGARVRWRDNLNIDKIEAGDLIPEPPYRTAPKRGEFALMRPRAESEPWVYVKIRATTDEFKVEDVKGDILHVGATALVPMTHPDD